MMTHSNQIPASSTKSQTATKGCPLETKALSKSDNLNSKKTKADFYQTVTDSVIQALENGVKPWACPWDETSCGMLPFNFKSGTHYSGINILLLWGAAVENGFKNAAWLTYKQAIDMGGQVRKGEKGTSIIFYKQYSKINKETGEEKVFVMKTYSVFNLDQIDGIEVKKTMELTEHNPLDFSQYSNIDSAIKNTDVKIIEMGIEAFYRPSTDEIYLPPKSCFNSASDFYATAFHELVHWTGAKTRLDRTKAKKFGDHDYAFEELIAELGSAFLMAEFGIVGEVQHASYIASWLKALKNDKKFIFQAASFASKAHQFICDFQEEEKAA